MSYVHPPTDPGHIRVPTPLKPSRSRTLPPGASEHVVVVPACERVYRYTGAATSSQTVTELLRTLRDLSAKPHVYVYADLAMRCIAAPSYW